MFAWKVDDVDNCNLFITAITTRSSAVKNLDAISGPLEAIDPDPIGLIERVGAYLDARAQASAESAQAAWTSDWLRRRQEWLGRVGKLLTSAEVAAISPTMKTSAAVHKARHEGRLLAVELGDRVYFPAFQFHREGTPAPWVRELVAALPDAPTCLQFLAAGRKEPKGRSYAEILREEHAGSGTNSTVERLIDEAKTIALTEAR